MTQHQKNLQLERCTRGTVAIIKGHYPDAWDHPARRADMSWREVSCLLDLVTYYRKKAKL